MFMQYTPDSYPRYKNYKAININKIKEIPYDYYEAMGVPVSFLKSYNPDQFQILSLLNEKDAPNYYITGSRWSTLGRRFIYVCQVTDKKKIIVSGNSSYKLNLSHK